jgi:hypothetical protein
VLKRGAAKDEQEKIKEQRRRRRRRRRRMTKGEAVNRHLSAGRMSWIKVRKKRELGQLPVRAKGAPCRNEAASNLSGWLPGSSD